MSKRSNYSAETTRAETTWAEEGVSKRPDTINTTYIINISIVWSIQSPDWGNMTRSKTTREEMSWGPEVITTRTYSTGEHVLRKYAIILLGRATNSSRFTNKNLMLKSNIIISRLLTMARVRKQYLIHSWLYI